MPDDTKTRPPETVYVLVDDSEDIARFGGPKEIDADKLGAELQKFSSAISRALAQTKTIAGEFVLLDIELQAKFSAEFGFVFVSKAGVEGSVTLKFHRSTATATALQ